MKRKLFNFVLLTTMVAGGATLSAKADTFYFSGQSTGFTCNAGSATCSDFIDGRPVYGVGGQEGQQGSQLSESSYELLQYIPAP